MRAVAALAAVLVCAWIVCVHCEETEEEAVVAGEEDAAAAVGKCTDATSWHDLHAMASVFYKKGRMIKGIACMQAGRRKYPEHKSFLTGWIYGQVKNNAPAAEVQEMIDKAHVAPRSILGADDGKLTVTWSRQLLKLLGKKDMWKEAVKVAWDISIATRTKADMLQMADVCRKAGDYKGEAYALSEAQLEDVDDVEVTIRRGRAYLNGDQPKEAMGVLRPAAQKGPANAMLLRTLAIAEARANLTGAALNTIQKAIALNGTDFATHLDMGVLLATLNRTEEARQALKTAQTLNPKSRDVFIQRHFFLVSSHDAAMQTEALEMMNDWLNLCLSTAASKHGCVQDACALVEQSAVYLSPVSPEVASACFNAGVPATIPMHKLLDLHNGTAEELLQLAKSKFDNLVDTRNVDSFKKAHPFTPGQRRVRSSDVDLRLKIGYIGSFSPALSDLSGLTRVLALHNTSAVSVACFHLGHEMVEETFFSQVCGSWFDLRNSSLPEIAHKIYEQKVDVAVNFDPWRQDVVEGVFAVDPAPVQVVWSRALLGTTGNPTSYASVDTTLLPPEYASTVSERIAYVPSAFFSDAAAIYDRFSVSAQHIAAQRHELGLGLHAPVLATAASPNTVDEHIVREWAQVVKAVKGSQMVLPPAALLATTQLHKIAKKHGVDSRRLHTFPQPTPRQRMVAINAVLENAHMDSPSNTADNAWFGVATIAQVGARMSQRASAAVLAAADCSSLIVNGQNFVSAATRVARTLSDPPRRLACFEQSKLLTRSLFHAPMFVGLWEVQLKLTWELRVLERRMHVVVNAGSVVTTAA